jgi:hypothetical protein
MIVVYLLEAQPAGSQLRSGKAELECPRAIVTLHRFHHPRTRRIGQREGWQGQKYNQTGSQYHTCMTAIPSSHFGSFGPPVRKMTGS